ncbi:hypothetical protein [Crenobacter cavernae]|uniref:Uncharacterized protein n=1 Tax=Crenobacter cavernae TaxID=2290923 RepID=A0A345Y8F5_9NEIS|nr:hypothetical protein [Crenobacter cavernae]AXK40207.1 hypothetical protein DWG20_12570 [Crenobacter cavernae]
MIPRTLQYILAAAAIIASSTAGAEGKMTKSAWQKEFGITKCNLQTTGQNQYFVMEPGFRLELEGGDTKLHITVLDETKMVDGVSTRVVEEREWKDGKLYEVSKNYFAMCEQTKDVFYFGEDVDYYENDKVVKHDGTWLAGQDGNKAGLIMAGTPRVGMRYYQEMAPGVAMDRAEIVSLNDTCKTPAGTFSKCLKVKEGTPLKMFETEYKYYAPNIGLIRDEDLRLIKYGFIKK